MQDLVQFVFVKIKETWLIHRINSKERQELVFYIVAILRGQNLVKSRIGLHPSFILIPDTKLVAKFLVFL
jgi:hypothetical protein